MAKRRRFKQTVPLKDRLDTWAQEVRVQPSNFHLVQSEKLCSRKPVKPTLRPTLTIELSLRGSRRYRPPLSCDPKRPCELRAGNSK